MSSIKLFESKQVRTYWYQDKQTWYFSVIDVIEVLLIALIPETTGLR